MFVIVFGAGFWVAFGVAFWVAFGVVLIIGLIVRSVTVLIGEVLIGAGLLASGPRRV